MVNSSNYFNMLNNYNNFLKELDNNKHSKINLMNIKNIPELKLQIFNEFNENELNTPSFTGQRKEDKIEKEYNDDNEPSFYDEINLPCFAPPLIKKKINIDFEINFLKDIIYIINTYPLSEEVEYNINMDVLHNLKEELIELDEMIGMNNLKKNILDQLLYYLQDLHIQGNDFMHTVLYGPPGTGKTEIAKIIGKIYSKMGVLKSGIFKKVTRSDFISGYLGQTALKTKDLIKECLGGVLFIDEAYALGNPEKKDSFSKECLDTLCEALSDYKENLMVIIAGYENDLKECFFSYNQGLDSRFTWRFKTDKYSAIDLKNIFIKKVLDIGWTIEKVDVEWFEKKMDYFKYFGRDMEILLSRIKIVHSKRVFYKDISEKKNISLIDMDNGFNLFLDNEEVKNRKYNPSQALSSMYI